MSPLTVGALPPLAPLSPLSPPSQPQANEKSGSFQQMLGQFLGANTDATQKADQAIQALATGQANDLHTVAMAVAEADLTFRMLLEMRNRLTEAYQEVIRMQV